jgi:lipoyl(octanoyl) transferase
MQQTEYSKWTNLIRAGRIAYPEAWTLQQQLLEKVISRKLDNRDALKAGLLPKPVEHYFILCEHPHVYTLGRNGSEDNLLLDEAGLQAVEATFHKINRGGDITYHGIGQVVGYPIFDLDDIFTDIAKFVRYVEEAGIRVCAQYGIEAGRVVGQSGVWLDPDGPKARKIMAIGIHLSRWVTMHGFAFNVNTNLDYFKNIVPCGIPDKGVTSLQAELGRAVPLQEVEEALMFHYREIFGLSYQKIDIKQLTRNL